MRRLIFFAVIAMPMAHAQFFGGIATEFTQAANNLELVSMYARQLKQLTAALDTYNEIVRAGQLLSHMQWTSAMQDISNIGLIVQQGQAVSYSLANLDAQFRAAYPGYGSGGLPYFQKYQKWSQVTLDTIRGTVQGNSISWQQMQSEQAMIRYYQSQAGSITTQMQATQFGHQIGVETLNQMNKLRQLTLADMQSKQAYQAFQVQKEIHAQEFEQTFFAPGRAGRDGVGW